MEKRRVLLEDLGFQPMGLKSNAKPSGGVRTQSLAEKHVESHVIRV